MSKTNEAARLIAQGKSLGQVISIVNRMPGLAEGSNQGAQAVVAGYRQEALDQVWALRDLVEHVDFMAEAATDHDLNRVALCCEVAAGAIQRYLRVREAGGLEVRGC